MLSKKKVIIIPVEEDIWQKSGGWYANDGKHTTGVWPIVVPEDDHRAPGFSCTAQYLFVGFLSSCSVELLMESSNC